MKSNIKFHGKWWDFEVIKQALGQNFRTQLFVKNFV